MSTYDYISSNVLPLWLVERGRCSCGGHILAYMAYMNGVRIRHGLTQLPSFPRASRPWIADASSVLLPRDQVELLIPWDAQPVKTPPSITPADQMQALAQRAKDAGATLYRYGSALTRPDASGDLDLLLRPGPRGLAASLEEISRIEHYRHGTDAELQAIFTLPTRLPLSEVDLLRLMRTGLPYFFLGQDRVDLMVAPSDTDEVLPHDEDLGVARDLRGTLVGPSDDNWAMPRAFRISTRGKVLTVKTITWYLQGVGALAGTPVSLRNVRPCVQTGDYWLSPRHSSIDFASG